MRDLREYVADYVRQLSGPGANDAWHSLVDAGPPALPHIVDAFNSSSDVVARLALVQIIGSYRSADAVPFFAGCLRNTDSDIWKTALDGLVSLGGRPALDALTVMLDTTTLDKREWIAEAIEQIKAIERAD